jgi:hypothetical protein
MGLGGEVLQEQGIHHSFEADMKLGDFAFGRGNDLHTGQAQTLEQSRHSSLIARDQSKASASAISNLPRWASCDND